MEQFDSGAARKSNAGRQPAKAATSRRLDTVRTRQPYNSLGSGQPPQRGRHRRTTRQPGRLGRLASMLSFLVGIGLLSIGVYLVFLGKDRQGYSLVLLLGAGFVAGGLNGRGLGTEFLQLALRWLFQHMRR